MENSTQSYRFTVVGAKTPMGIRYASISDAEAEHWVRLTGRTSREIEEALATGGLTLIGSTRTRVLNDIGALSIYRSQDLAERPGWVGQSYFLPDGSSFSPEGHSNRTPVVFSPDGNRCTAAGSLKGWRRHVAEQITGQMLPCFVVMAAFAGPLLKLTNRTLNILIEIFGSGGNGKSLAQMIGGSVLGPVLDRGQGVYQLSLNATSNFLEEQADHYSDSYMILDELQAFHAGESTATRQKKLQELIFRLAQGQPKGRFGQARLGRFDVLALLSANEPIRDLLGGLSEHLAQATESRLISIPADAGQGYHIFDHPPAGFEGGRAYAEFLKRQMVRHHGTAFPAYIKGLVELRAQNEGLLRQKIAARIADFHNLLGIDPNDGMAGRVAEVFGLVATGGRLAKYMGVLPAGWKPNEIAAECYRRYASAASESKSPIQSLNEYVQRKDLINLDDGYPDLTSEQLLSCPGFLKTLERGRELRMVPSRIGQLFPNWKRVMTSKELDDVVFRDGQHFTVKRQLTLNGGKQRAIVFRV